MTVAFSRLLAALDLTQPFVGRWELERRRGRPYRARLGANECLFGVSPAALQMLAAKSGELAFYPDPAHAELRDLLAASFGATRPEIVIAEGIEGLLGLFVRAFIEAGDVAVTSLGGYPSFDYYVRGCGGRVVQLAYLPAGENDLEALLTAARRESAKLVYLANPDNPTGTQVRAAELREFIGRLPPDCLLLLDEAYFEFANQEEVLAPSERAPNLVRMRTFSKAYGLAGARVGYALAPAEIAAPLDRIRQHFAVSRLAQEIARAAFEDREFVDQVVAETARGREHYSTIAHEIGACVLPAFANFVAFDFGNALRARAVTEQLEAHDIFVRRVSEPPLDRLIRITVGPAELRAYLAEVLYSAG